MHPLATRANSSQQQDNNTHPYKVLRTTNPRKAAILSKLVDANRKAKGLWALIDHAGTHAGPWTWNMYQLMDSHRGRPEPQDMVHHAFMKARKTVEKMPAGFKLKRAKGAAESVAQAHNKALSNLINIGIASPPFMKHAHTIPPPPNYGVPISSETIEKIVSSGNMKLIDNILRRPSTNPKITKLVELKMLHSGKVEIVKEALRRYTFSPSELKDALDDILAKRRPFTQIDILVLHVLFEHLLAINSTKNTQFATRFLKRYVSLPASMEVNESIVRFLINRLGANARNVDIYNILLKKPSVSTVQSLDLLLRKGAPVSGTNNRGYGTTPLHHVKNHQFAEILMKHGANAYARTRLGGTPISMIKNKRVLEVIQRYATQNNRSSKKARKNN